MRSGWCAQSQKYGPALATTGKSSLTYRQDAHFDPELGGHDQFLPEEIEQWDRWEQRQDRLTQELAEPVSLAGMEEKR